MHRTGNVPAVMCLWPGLAGLWFLGRWSALISAITFGLLLNSALVSSFIWPAIVSSNVTSLLWTITIAWCCISVWQTWWQRESMLNILPEPTTDQDPLLQEAQLEYLGGNLDDAAAMAERILFSSPRDVEARLLLATICRRQNKLDTARDQLEAIEKYDRSVRWKDEIEQEWVQVEAADDLLEQNSDSQPDEEDDRAINSHVETPQHKKNSETNGETAPTAIPETLDIETIEDSKVIESDIVKPTDGLDELSLEHPSIDNIAIDDGGMDDKGITEFEEDVSISEQLARQLSTISADAKTTSANRRSQSKRIDAA